MIIADAASRKRYGGNRVLEYQLLLRPRFQNHRILVEALDSPRKLDSAHEVDRDVAALFPGTVEKAVLYGVLLLYRFFHLLTPQPKNFRSEEHTSELQSQF